MPVCETTPRPRDLRRTPTIAERRLLLALDQHFPAARFRRQVPITPYLAGFLSFGARLIVELDEDRPADAAADDGRRTEFLERKGYRLLRVPGGDGLRNLPAILETVAQHLAAVPGQRRRPA